MAWFSSLFLKLTYRVRISMFKNSLKVGNRFFNLDHIIFFQFVDIYILHNKETIDTIKSVAFQTVSGDTYVVVPFSSYEVDEGNLKSYYTIQTGITEIEKLVSQF